SSSSSSLPLQSFSVATLHTLTSMPESVVPNDVVITSEIDQTKHQSYIDSIPKLDTPVAPCVSQCADLQSNVPSHTKEIETTTATMIDSEVDDVKNDDPIGGLCLWNTPAMEMMVKGSSDIDNDRFQQSTDAMNEVLCAQLLDEDNETFQSIARLWGDVAYQQDAKADQGKEETSENEDEDKDENEYEIEEPIGYKDQNDVDANSSLSPTAATTHFDVALDTYPTSAYMSSSKVIMDEQLSKENESFFESNPKNLEMVPIITITITITFTITMIIIMTMTVIKSMYSFGGFHENNIWKDEDMNMDSEGIIEADNDKIEAETKDMNTTDYFMSASHQDESEQDLAVAVEELKHQYQSAIEKKGESVFYSFPPQTPAPAPAPALPPSSSSTTDPFCELSANAQVWSHSHDHVRQSIAMVPGITEVIQTGDKSVKGNPVLRKMMENDIPITSMGIKATQPFPNDYSMMQVHHPVNQFSQSPPSQSHGGFANADTKVPSMMMRMSHNRNTVVGSQDMNYIIPPAIAPNPVTVIKFTDVQPTNYSHLNTPSSINGAWHGDNTGYTNHHFINNNNNNNNKITKRHHFNNNNKYRHHKNNRQYHHNRYFRHSGNDVYKLHDHGYGFASTQQMGSAYGMIDIPPLINTHLCVDNGSVNDHSIYHSRGRQNEIWHDGTTPRRFNIQQHSRMDMFVTPNS
ncbi:transcription factor, partial [Reticulomyxa filosa]